MFSISQISSILFTVIIFLFTLFRTVIVSALNYLPPKCNIWIILVLAAHKHRSQHCLSHKHRSQFLGSFLFLNEWLWEFCNIILWTFCILLHSSEDYWCFCFSRQLILFDSNCKLALAMGQLKCQFSSLCFNYKLPKYAWLRAPPETWAEFILTICRFLVCSL